MRRTQLVTQTADPAVAAEVIARIHAAHGGLHVIASTSEQRSDAEEAQLGTNG